MIYFLSLNSLIDIGLCANQDITIPKKIPRGLFEHWFNNIEICYINYVVDYYNVEEKPYSTNCFTAGALPLILVTVHVFLSLLNPSRTVPALTADYLLVNESIIKAKYFI